jgi:hypothetical protein
VLHTIDIDLGPVNGTYEPVCYRKAKKGESYLCETTQCVAEARDDHDRPSMIVRKKWQWPSWLAAEWIFLSPNGKWFATDKEPVARTANWECLGVIVCLSFHMFEFSPPPCDDWRNSKKRNPNLAA